jgi:dihydrofolate synthase / folylpolyglutamate synthase
VTLDELTPWLFARSGGGIRWGLERTELLLAGVGDPHREFPSILIGGTNGKGSVAALCDSALRAGRELRVGLYTSPHLVSFTERVRIDGAPVDEVTLARAALRLRPAIEHSGASFFEATTAVAFLVLAEAGVDLAVVEVGLGGRLDSTNALLPLATAVTTIARDHAEYLGAAPEQIAGEKAGIFKPGVPVVVGVPAEEAAVQRVLAGRAREVGAPYHLLDDVASLADVRTSPRGTEFVLRSRAWGAIDLRIPLPGLHQARNAALAAELLALLPARFRPDPPALTAGFRSVRWPGRMQIETIRGTTWLLDVAHNPAGARALAESLDLLELPAPRVVVLGVLADKEWREMLPPLLNRADAVILTVPKSAPPVRRWDPEAAARWAAAESGVAARVVPELARALERATTLAPHGTIVVTGSVHTVGDALTLLELPGS